MRTITINNQEYSSNDVSVVFLGKPIIGITNIEYDMEKQKDYRYGFGGMPLGIQEGQGKPKGSITVYQSEYIALNRAARRAGYKDLTSIEGDMIVAYTRDGITTVDKIVCVSFSKKSSGMKSGDLQSEHQLPFLCLAVEDDITGV